MPKLPDRRPPSTSSESQGGVLDALCKLLQHKLRPAPKEWLRGDKIALVKTGAAGMECLPCSEYKVVVSAWRKALRWTEGLDSTLAVMLATVLSTRFVGEQLWIKVIGPPASGKTTILEGLAINKKYVFSKDTIRGFYSGWRGDGEDDSIAALAKNKTLATKDGDTLLKAPNLQQILSEARGLYDRVGRTHYRNQVANDYEGHRMTWILCGTAALREIDDSELGARFLDCVVMDEIDNDFEDAVGWRAANQEARNMLMEADGRPETNYPPELAIAMQLTGGYVGYLREDSVELASKVVVEPGPLRQCNRLGKFVAYMRARPSKDREENGREFSARLTKQLTRLAIALAAVLNRTRLDAEVMRRVTKVALDTSRGQTLAITEILNSSPKGGEVRGLAMRTISSDDKTRTILRFMKQIGVVESFKPDSRSQLRYKLTKTMKQLYMDVNR